MCGENSYIEMKLQQENQEEIEMDYKNEYCPPACNKCQNFQNDAVYRVYEQSLSQFEPNHVEELESNFCPCPEKCRMPISSPFLKRKYIQPPRRASCKPIVCCQKPTLPFANETIYKKSFECIDPKTSACCRHPIIRPRASLKCLDSAFEKETVSKLSFPSYCVLERAKPIVPKSSSLLGSGPMQEMTTQKHDFVSKFQYRRLKILPKDNIQKLCGCIEKETTQRLSFMPSCIVERRESFKPVIAYKKPEIPMECETTQKLSFLPNCPSARKEFPWAKKAKYQPPSIEFAKDTVTKLSFLAPGCFIDDNSSNLIPHIKC